MAKVTAEMIQDMIDGKIGSIYDAKFSPEMQMEMCVAFLLQENKQLQALLTQAVDRLRMPLPDIRGEGFCALIDSASSRVLRNQANSKSAKTAAGSALSQPIRKGK